MNMQERKDMIAVMKGFPSFVLREEVLDYKKYKNELLEICSYYNIYKKGKSFSPEGTSGDYVPSRIKYKQAKMLIDKEARFMFSRSPEVRVKEKHISDDGSTNQTIEQYQEIVNEVFERSKVSKKLLQGAKDCFIGKRIACLVDFSEVSGIQVHFYNALQFYSETKYGSEELSKFVSFECVQKSDNRNERLFLINRYEVVGIGKVSFSSNLVNGAGKTVEELIAHKTMDMKTIPAVIITNDGLLEDSNGVSDIATLMEYEEGYSLIANADIDSERKGMNPVRYTVDMNSATTRNLSSTAGSYWDLKSEQNQENIHPMIGTLAPSMNHTESVKTTLDRIKTTMHSELDIPNISEDGMLSGITSFKALKALYFPLQTRSDEKMKTWKQAIKDIVRIIIKTALSNAETVKELYVLSELKEEQYIVEVKENYALIDDELEDKANDMQEIANNTRSRKSYLEKWRGSEDLTTNKKIEEELLQIAVELNMFDTTSMNMQVQSRLDKSEAEQRVETEQDKEETMSRLQDFKDKKQ